MPAATKAADSSAQSGFPARVKGFVDGVMQKTHWCNVALSLMDSWLARG
jgi:hypothetical protein